MRVSLVSMLTILALPSSAQTYQGFQYATRTSQPTLNVPPNSTAYCDYGTSADPINYPPGCWIGGDVGEYLIGVGANQPLRAGGIGTLICQGAVPLVCTLVVVTPGNKHNPAVSFPPNHTQGSYNFPLGGHQGACNQNGLTIKSESSIEAGRLIMFDFNAANLGDGKCIVSSEGKIHWGDGVVEPVPAESTAGPNDRCAHEGERRIRFANLRIGHMYMTPGSVRIQAWMTLQVKNEYLGTISQRGTDASNGSWECHAVRWDDLTVVTPVDVTAAAQFKRGPCVVGRDSIDCKSKRLIHRAKVALGKTPLPGDVR